jgi:hypothetical protein
MAARIAGSLPRALARAPLLASVVRAAPMGASCRAAARREAPERI